MKKYLTFIIPFIILTGCGKSGNDTKPNSNNEPVAAIMLLPGENEICTTGTEISETQSSVKFTWKPALNATSYDLLVTNLTDGLTTTQSTKENKASIILIKGTPYSWTLISKSSASGATAKSETWKFYNAGPGVTSYAPFPADLIAPSNSSVISSGNVDLSWVGNAPANGNILNYDLYWGTSSTPPLFKTGISENNLVVPATSKTTYYWRVATRSAEGNVSYSQINKYFVN
ncbi:hypothetical protein D0C36_04405 [Mucilaginibacter conchicola]|uniref:Fibronectin type-III domain-containing protein n=1 Tax=Mucilaginibacter conchicola TaxID=2303333 RepID=A0A372NXD2_9SPHI|nr:hypothetical protein [Mucilaginibacter conchicola]RFZ94783.1 hypothetical protein D0C36_04405 [Mucilaginibacter conchicola]